MTIGDSEKTSTERFQMSRLYEMQVTISDFHIDKFKDIIKAWDEKWGNQEEADLNIRLPEDIGSAGNEKISRIDLRGEGTLSGGESEEEFVDSLSMAIWKANGGYCGINVIAIYLEDNPYNTYDPSKDDYFRLMVAPTIGKS